MIDIILFLINGGAWAIKPVLEKLSVDSIGYYDFVFIRYFFCGLIALFVLGLNYFNGKKLELLNIPHVNYNLLQKYDSSFVTPIVEAIILIMNAVLSVIILGERVTTDMIIGIFFILTGIVFIYREKIKLFS